MELHLSDAFMSARSNRLATDAASAPISTRPWRMYCAGFYNINYGYNQELMAAMPDFRGIFH